MTRNLTAAAALCAALLAPASLHTQAQTASPAPARVIVKLKADSGLLRKQALSAAERHAGQAQALGQRVGLALTTGTGVGERSQVVFASGMSSAALAERLARESDVEFAVPDRRKRLTAAPPSDKLYLTGDAAAGPAVGQWYLRAPDAAAATTATTVVSSINAEAAWTITTGSSSIVVAVLDTGIRFEHPDLKTTPLGGNLLPGYDMISDVATANDNDGRDDNASDPGDWLDQADIDSGNFAGSCTSADISDSSWHGTQTAGLIGALTNNVIGMASVGRNVRILPVRVLGKCGGLDSDIVAGMRWAAGIHIDGVIDNANPAKVINMSLGGGTTCTPLYQNAVDEITARGTVIVASAGNSAGHAVSEPASCAGVIGVAALRHIGSKVGFSDIGPEISISAPGGNCVNPQGAPCLYPILTTSNSGTTVPASSIYTDSINASLGTSFSAPLVAGTAALMLSVTPTLSPKEVKLLMRATARPFPTSGADNADGSPVLQCTATQFDSGGGPVDQDQCYCTTGVCGAGMLDAGAAVLAVSSGTPGPGVRARIDLKTARPVSGQALTLTAANSEVLGGRTIASYRWALVDGGGIVGAISNPTSRDAIVTPTAVGRFTINVTVVDSTSASSTTTMSILVATPPAPTPTPTGGGDGGGALGSGWLLTLLAAVLLLAPRSRPRTRS